MVLLLLGRFGPPGSPQGSSGSGDAERHSAGTLGCRHRVLLSPAVLRAPCDAELEESRLLLAWDNRWLRAGLGGVSRSEALPDPHRCSSPWHKAVTLFPCLFSAASPPNPCCASVLGFWSCFLAQEMSRTGCNTSAWPDAQCKLAVLSVIHLEDELAAPHVALQVSVPPWACCHPAGHPLVSLGLHHWYIRVPISGLFLSL